MIRQGRTAIYRTSVGVLLATVGLAVAVAAGSAEAATAGETLLQPTPLILKDGRIAKVSVHVVPFQPGGTEVAPAAADELAGLTRTVATDCFLTAQVIGHVGPTEVAENDSLAAHRLARSRADAVQASLIGGGLPAKSIASVWDWQFMVPEPRATLWVFRLTEGEDCDGTPLPGISELVAETETGAPAAQPTSTPKGRDGAAARQEAPPAPSDRASLPHPNRASPRRSLSRRRLPPGERRPLSPSRSTRPIERRPAPGQRPSRR
jgi:hypothetical protein